MVNYGSYSAPDKAAIETYLDGQGIIYNPDDSGASTSLDLGMNILIFPGGGYADASYLGNIPDGWDSDGNPISWTPDVHTHVASKEDLSSWPNPEEFYPNRFAGEQIPVPEEVESSIQTGSWTKLQIMGFMQDKLIPHHSSWTKAKLILAVLLWYGLQQ